MEGKLTNVQVIENLMQEMTESQKMNLKYGIEPYIKIHDPVDSARELIAHGIIDVNKGMEEGNVKSGLRQLMKKYISGSALREGEKEAYQKFLVYLGIITIE